MLRFMAVIFWLYVYLLCHQSSSLTDALGTCVLPAFSHRCNQASVWLDDRIRSSKYAPVISSDLRIWSNYGRFESGFDTSHMHDEYLNWVSGGILHEIKFLLINRRGPKRKSESLLHSRYEGLDLAAAVDLKAGDTILDVPRQYCLSDVLSEQDPLTLNGSPWELRLATKLLRERSRSEGSMWYSFIKLLPSRIRLPLFFSDAELKGCEDSSLIDEVLSMRSFIETSFHALHQYETAGASFNEFAWALAIVYTSACEITLQDSPSAGHVHLLLPFFSSTSDSSVAKATIAIHGETVKVVMQQDAPKFGLIAVDYGAQSWLDLFVYHGFVRSVLPDDRISIFKNLQDLWDWIIFIHEKSGLDKESLLECIQSGERIYNQSVESSFGVASKAAIDFSVAANGYISHHMLYIIHTLVNTCYGDGDTNIFASSSMDGSLEDVQQLYKLLTAGNMSTYLSELSATALLGVVEPFKPYARKEQLTAFVIGLVQKRLQLLLDAYSTCLSEDESLLMSSLWEGFSDETGSHLCDTCQWPTEELSFNDYLGVQLRLRKKFLLLNALSILNFSMNMPLLPLGENLKMVEEHFWDSTNQFLKWCEEQGAELSQKVELAYFNYTLNPRNSKYKVRGVQVVQDIKEGEAICVLPLHMGLFEKGASQKSGADSWHLAAANLLREKARGVDSKWAPYISVLPKSMPTPIYLHPSEIKEVQWWPLIRELIQIRQAITKSFSQFTGADIAWADFDQYRWAVTMVHSRAFTLPVEEDGEYAPYVLMPFMDMINHHYEYQADWISLPIKHGKLEITAKRHVHKGEQIFATFGPRSNDNLFLYYGFILEKNPFETAQIFSSFEDGVKWFISLWGWNCEKDFSARAWVTCEQEYLNKHWIIAKVAIDNYAAGITEQRLEWWNLMNTWADYGNEYMQFQPSPSLYINGIVDPTLMVAFEAVVGSMDPSKFVLHQNAENCKYGTCGSTLVSNLRDWVTCIDSLQWLDVHTTLHSSLCSKFLSWAVIDVDNASLQGLIVKMSLVLRCLEILHSFPTTIEEDKLLLEQNFDDQDHMHLALTLHYRYVKKMFFREYIHHVLNLFS